MPTATSQTAMDEQGEFVLLPPEVAFGRDVEVTIVRSGDVLTIYPVGSPVPPATERLKGPDR